MTHRATGPRDDAADKWFDLWRGAGHLLTFGGGAAYYGVSPAAGSFNGRLAHWRGRRNALGAALALILSAPGEAADALARYRRAAGEVPGVSAAHLPVLLWYRELALGLQDGDEQRGDLRREVLATMIALIRRDIWPRPAPTASTADAHALIMQWKTLATAARSARGATRAGRGH